MNAVCVADTALPNKECTTVTPGSSMSSADSTCLPDCKDIADKTKTVNVPGYHDVSGVCTADSGAGPKPDPKSAVWMGTSMAALVSTLALVMYM